MRKRTASRHQIYTKLFIVLPVCFFAGLLFTAGQTGASTFFHEDFDAGVIPPGWTIQGPGTATWQNVLSGNDNCMQVVSNLDPQDEWLISPVIDCSTYGSVYLSYSHVYDDYDSGDVASVHVSSDGGTSWPVTLVSYTADDARTHIFDISGTAAGQSNVKVAFQYVSFYDYHWTVDNVALHGGNDPLLYLYETYPDSNNRDAMFASLDANGYSYSYINRDDSPGPVTGLEFWPTIIWTEHEYMYNFYPNDSEQADLITFLQNASSGDERSLFIVGPDIGYGTSTTSFFQEYLHAEFIVDNTSAIVMKPVVQESTAVLDEDFNHGGVLAPGWTIQSQGPGNNWYVDLISGSDYQMTVSYGGGAQDERLISPIIDCSGETEVMLSFDYYYNDYSANDVATVDLSIDGGLSFPYNIVTYNDAGSSKYDVFDITSIAAGVSQVMVRFRYQGNNDWLFQVDNVRMGALDPVSNMDSLSFSATYSSMVRPNPTYPGAVAVYKCGSSRAFKEEAAIRYAGCESTNYNTTYVAAAQWNAIGDATLRAELLKRIIDGFQCGSVIPELVFNEIQIGLQNGMEIFNAGNNPVDLAGWEIDWTDTTPDSGNFVLPAFILPPASYVELLEGSGTNDADTLYLGGPLGWTQMTGGSAALLDPTLTGIDFVRWGGSVQSAPSGTAWFEPVIAPTPTAAENLSRDALSTDTDSSEEWCLQVPSLTFFNPPVDDGDGIHVCLDNCPSVFNPTQDNYDGDDFGDLCDDDDDNDGTDDTMDCSQFDDTLWSVPAPFDTLLLNDPVTTTLVWSLSDPGCINPVYDVLRSTIASDFSGAVCLETNDTDTTALDSAVLPPDTIFFYLIRAENPCGEQMGMNSDSIPRTGILCD